jgi:hypothetical protein
MLSFCLRVCEANSANLHNNQVIEQFTDDVERFFAMLQFDDKRKLAKLGVEIGEDLSITDF